MNRDTKKAKTETEGNEGRLEKTTRPDFLGRCMSVLCTFFLLPLILSYYYYYSTFSCYFRRLSMDRCYVKVLHNFPFLKTFPQTVCLPLFIPRLGLTIDSLFLPSYFLLLSVSCPSSLPCVLIQIYRLFPFIFKSLRE